MEKKCFIILPMSDPDGYSKGHFNRVYQYIIMPACRLAGFTPIRVGDPNMDDTPLGIINTIIETDIVICDLSSNDTHALYGFAIRQATGLPVALIKDLKTTLNANIPEFDIVEYDESLRIDTVEGEIETLGESLKKTFADKAEPNQIISRLNIRSSNPEPEIMPVYTYAETTSIPSPNDEDKDSLEKEIPLPIISPLPDNVGEPLTQHEIDQLKVGDFFFHLNYGKGEILTINHKTKDILSKVKFDNGSKVLVLMPSSVFRKIID